jgi:hypothetical protein
VKISYNNGNIKTFEGLELTAFNNILAINMLTKVVNLDSKKKTKEITIYPNPSLNGNFKIHGIEEFKEIEITNIVGNKISQIKNLNQSSINVSIHVQPGVYFIKLSNTQQSIYKKISIK